MQTAFVLSGGGAKGAFQMGVLKGLAAQGIIPDVIYGTSVGAINAAGYACLGLDGLERFWRDIKGRKDILGGGGWFSVLRAVFQRRRGVFGTEPLRRLLQENLRTAPPRIRAVVCAVNMATGEPQYRDTTTCWPDTFADEVLASCSMPILMNLFDDLADGGVREVTPLSKAIHEGADRIYAVLASPYNEHPIMQGPVGGLKDIIQRTLEIMHHEVFLNDIKVCFLHNWHQIKRHIKLFVYAPPEALLDTLEFDPDKIRRAIEQGEKAVEAGPIPEERFR